ncbi:peptidase inhibitor family I36 protein [Streptomyces noursei]|uniref:peptidase inhibitor family I36 protein n=1 Tax=Streptomyces noursei TaxID=1971 RepID=UPI003816D929
MEAAIRKAAIDRDDSVRAYFSSETVRSLLLGTQAIEKWENVKYLVVVLVAFRGEQAATQPDAAAELERFHALWTTAVDNGVRTPSDDKTRHGPRYQLWLGAAGVLVAITVTLILWPSSSNSQEQRGPTSQASQGTPSPRLPTADSLTAPKAATPGFSECPEQRFCAFSKPDATGKRASFQFGADNLGRSHYPYLDRSMGSLWNRTAEPWCLYTENFHEGTATRIPAGEGGNVDQHVASSTRSFGPCSHPDLPG